MNMMVSFARESDHERAARLAMLFAAFDRDDMELGAELLIQALDAFEPDSDLEPEHDLCTAGDDNLSDFTLGEMGYDFPNAINDEDAEPDHDNERDHDDELEQLPHDVPSIAVYANERDDKGERPFLGFTLPRCTGRIQPDGTPVMTPEI